jgi:transposase
VSDFETGQIVGARLAGTSVTKTATMLGVSRTTVSEVMSAYTNHGKTTVNRNSGRKSTLTQKRSSYIVKDCFEKSQNYCRASDRTANLNIHLKDTVSTKTVQGNLSLPKPIHLSLWITIK